MSIYNNRSSDYFKPIKSGEFKIPTENYKKILEQPNDSKIHSNLLRKDIDVWQNAKVDLNRLGNLKINDSTVIDVTFKPEPADKVHTKVIDNLLALLNEDEEAAQQMVKLLEQYWGTVTVKLLLQGEDGDEVDFEATKRLTALSHTHNIKIEKGQFKVIHEALYQVSNKNDPEADEFPFHYVKAKVLISGNVQDLKNKDYSKIQFKFLNTDEKVDPKEVTESKYGGILQRFIEDYNTSFNK